MISNIVRLRESESVSQLCPTFCHPMDCSPPGFSVHGILQARILEWVAIPFFQEILPTEIKPSLPNCRQIFCCLSGSLRRTAKWYSCTYICSFSNSIHVLLQNIEVTVLYTSLLLFSRSVVSNSLWPHDGTRPAFLVLHHLPELVELLSTDLVMPSNHFISCHPHFLLPSIFPSIRVFSSELAFHIRWPKYWGFSFSISPSHEYSGLIAFKIDWLDLLAVQGTLKNLLQWHSSKASILQYLAFFMVHL